VGSGIGGQTIDAQMRASELMGVQGGWLLDFQRAVEEFHLEHYDSLKEESNESTSME